MESDFPDDMMCSDFVEEEMEVTIKMIVLGASCSGKSELVQKYITPSTKFSPMHTATNTNCFYEKRLDGDDGTPTTLMIWDLPPFEVMYPPNVHYAGVASTNPDLKHASLFKGIGGIALVLDLFNETFSLPNTQRIIARVKRETGDRLPPVTVVFSKWDLVDKTDSHGFDVKALYDGVLDLLDEELTQNGYASVRASSKDGSNVEKIFEMTARNYFRWGKGSSKDVLQDVAVLSAKKPKTKKERTEKKERKEKEKEKQKKQEDADKSAPSSPKKPKQLFASSGGDGAAAGNGDVDQTASGGASGDGSEANGDSTAATGATPRKRRTGGKKSAKDQLQAAAKNAVPQNAECILS
jgi:GTPase SAR1 family protein